MKIKCLACDHSEEVDLDLFVKIIGVAMPAGGFWAWTTYFFAGTGFALPIVIAIMTGGVAILAFKDEIVEWIVNQGYQCSKCGGQKWKPTSDEIEDKLKSKDSRMSDLKNKNEKYESEISHLKESLDKQQSDFLNYVSSQDSFFSYDDIEDILSELEEKNNKIESLLKDKKDWPEQKELFFHAQDKVADKLNKRFKNLYPSLIFTSKSITRVARLDEIVSLKLEREFSTLQHTPNNINFRDKIIGSDVFEVEFNKSGRLYIRRDNNNFEVVCVGDKKSQHKDLKWLRENYNKG
jgi:hypothetical protein